MDEQTVKLLREMHRTLLGGRSLSQARKDIDSRYGPLATIKRTANTLK